MILRELRGSDHPKVDIQLVANPSRKSDQSSHSNLQENAKSLEAAF